MFQLFLPIISGIQLSLLPLLSLFPICPRPPSSPAGLAEHWTGFLPLLAPSSMSSPTANVILLKRRADHMTALFKNLQLRPIPCLWKLESCQGAHQVLPAWFLDHLLPDLTPHCSLLSSLHSGLPLGTRLPVFLSHTPGLAFAAVPSAWNILSWDGTCLLPLHLQISPKCHLSEAFLPWPAHLHVLFVRGYLRPPSPLIFLHSIYE